MNSVTDKQFVATVTSQLGWNDQFASALDYAAAADQPDNGRPRSVDVADAFSKWVVTAIRSLRPC